MPLPDPSAWLQLSTAGDPLDLPTETLRLFVGGRELLSDSALVSEVGLGNGHVMHAQASHRCALCQRLRSGAAFDMLFDVLQTECYTSVHSGNLAAGRCLVALMYGCHASLL